MSNQINEALNEFSNHWKLDGDYLRCVKCNRPHIASMGLMPFVHQHGCKLEGKSSPHPWLLLREILK